MSDHFSANVWPLLGARRIIELEHAIAEKQVAFADEQDISKASR